MGSGSDVDDEAFAAEKDPRPAPAPELLYNGQGIVYQCVRRGRCGAGV